MRKLVEISRPNQCPYREVSFTELHIYSGESNVIGYGCSHPKCTAEYLKSINKDFLPCNSDYKFPKRCLLVDENPSLIAKLTEDLQKPNEAGISMSPEVAEKIANTMDIYAKRGTAVRLQMKDGEIFGGYDGEKKLALIHLKPDVIYHVLRTEVDNWSTDVYLEEVPGIGFNSVMFEHVKE